MSNSHSRGCHSHSQLPTQSSQLAAPSSQLTAQIVNSGRKKIEAAERNRTRWSDDAIFKVNLGSNQAKRRGERVTQS